MNTIVLVTESYLIKEKQNERFFPFLELEYNEWIIYENDKPKYYIELQSDTESEFKVINWLVSKLKEGKDLRNLIIFLGKQNNKNWDIFPTQKGMEVENSFHTERIELEFLTDKIIKTQHNNQ